ncbi:MAG: hypothetical protein WC375_00030 [Methanomassiliicoccales archaeon]|jgi:hypothetical protein
MKMIKEPPSPQDFQDFCKRMEQVEKNNEQQVGRASSGCSRATFVFDGQVCFLESVGAYSYSAKEIAQKPALALRMMFAKPEDYWWTDFMVYGKSEASRVANHYKAWLFEAPYAKEKQKWFHLCFSTFEGLMHFVYDRKMKAYAIGYQPAYESCL